MEDFISEIYLRADIIEQFKETSNKMKKMWVEAAGVQWNKTVAPLRIYMEEYVSLNPELADHIMDVAEAVTEAYRDPAEFTSLIDAKLIPLLLNYIQDYCGIEVTEDRFVIKSSQTGFLTVYDKNQNIYFHSFCDPMWEAHIFAESLWRPHMEEFHLFGAGLGYLAYQIWKISEESTRIVIYEKSEQMLQYAFHFGVLSWIPDEYLEIVLEKDTQRLSKQFQENKKNPNSGYYISTWMGMEYASEDKGELAYERMNSDACRWFENLWGINLRENRKRVTTTIGRLREELSHDHWIVVAAGPSLEQNIEWIRASAGTKRIVAVDVVLKRLLNEGIKPDIVVIGDPKDQMLKHIEGMERETESIPLIADRLANWRYVKAYRGPIALMTAQNSVERFGEAEDMSEGNWNIGGTVSSLAIETAVRFLGKTIWLAGLDLAYPEGKHFVEGTMHDKDNMEVGSCIVESMDGGYVKTSKTFIFFKGIIERQIAQYPNVDFINMSPNGARIKGCKKFDENIG